jgi:hypothetical protein
MVVMITAMITAVITMVPMISATPAAGENTPAGGDQDDDGY